MRILLLLVCWLSLAIASGESIRVVMVLDANGAPAGTGFFAKNCTVFTALHVVRPDIFLFPPTIRSTPVKGQVFQFLAKDGSVRGSFRVIENGDYDQGSIDESDANDWVIGQDPDCTAKKPGFDYFEIDAGKRYADLIDRRLEAHGFGRIPNLKANGKRIFVDRDCRLVQEKMPNYWLTNCASGPGSSGGVIAMRRFGRRPIALMAIVGPRRLPEGSKQGAIAPEGTAAIPIASFHGKIRKLVNSR